MAVEGGAKIIKYLMFFFNFILFLSGIAIIVAGALVFTTYNDYVTFTESSGKAIPIFLLVVGIFVLFTGFLGCCGAIRENYCMVCMFAIIIVILLLAELGGGIAGYVLRDQIKNTIEQNMNKSLHNYNNTANQNAWNTVQKDLKCCGVKSYQDWEKFYGKDEVPKSCCMTNATDCTGDPGFNPHNVYSEGCLNALYNFLEKNIVIIGAIAIAVALIQVFGVICSCCLMRSIKSEYEVV